MHRILYAVLHSCTFFLITFSVDISFFKFVVCLLLALALLPVVRFAMSPILLYFEVFQIVCPIICVGVFSDVKCICPALVLLLGMCVEGMFVYFEQCQ